MTRKTRELIKGIIYALVFLTAFTFALLINKFVAITYLVVAGIVILINRG